MECGEFVQVYVVSRCTGILFILSLNCVKPVRGPGNGRLTQGTLVIKTNTADSFCWYASALSETVGTASTYILSTMFVLRRQWSERNRDLLNYSILFRTWPFPVFLFPVLAQRLLHPSFEFKFLCIQSSNNALVKSEPQFPVFRQF